MPSLPITGSPNVSSFDFKTRFDLITGKIIIDLSPTVWTGSGANNVTAALIKLISPAGVVLKDGTVNDFVPPMTNSVEISIPKVGGIYQWGPYQIELTLKETVAEQERTYTNKKFFRLCAPNPKNLKSNTGVAQFKIEPHCLKGYLTISGGEGYTYAGKKATLWTKNISYYFPPETIDHLSGIDTTPFNLDLYTGANTLKGASTGTFTFDDNFSAKVKFIGEEVKNIQCSLDLCKVYCELARLMTILTSNKCGSNEYKEADQKIEKAMKYVTLILVGTDCGQDTSSFISSLEKILNIECSTCNDGQKIEGVQDRYETIINAQLDDVNPACIATAQDWAGMRFFERFQALINYVCNFIPPPCVQASIVSGAVLPDAIFDTPYNHTIVLGGSAPFSLSTQDIIKPDWMSIIVDGSNIVFSGTPTAGDDTGDVDVQFRITNCSTANPIDFDDTVTVSEALPEGTQIVGFRMAEQLFSAPENETVLPESAYISQAGDGAITYANGVNSSLIDFKFKKLGFSGGDNTSDGLALEYLIPAGVVLNTLESVDGDTFWLLHCTVDTSATTIYHFHKAMTLTIGGLGRGDIMAGANIRVIRQGDLATIATITPVGLSADGDYPGWGDGAFLENVGSFKAWSNKGYRIDVMYDLFTEPAAWGWYGIADNTFSQIGNIPGLASDVNYPIVPGMIKGAYDIAIAIKAADGAPVFGG